MACEGCAARDRMIGQLLEQLDRAQDRTMAALNPTVYQIYRGKPVSDVATAYGEPVQHGTDGQQYVRVGGATVPLEEYERTMERLEEYTSERTPLRGAPGVELNL